MGARAKAIQQIFNLRDGGGGGVDTLGTSAFAADAVHNTRQYEL
jgi:hypothetical protein